MSKRLPNAEQRELFVNLLNGCVDWDLTNPNALAYSAHSKLVRITRVFGRLSDDADVFYVAFYKASDKGNNALATWVITQINDPNLFKLCEDTLNSVRQNFITSFLAKANEKFGN